jgi:hypothetical protein
MTPSKRRPATPASQGPTRTAPDVPIVADPPSVPPPPTPGGVPAPDVPTAPPDAPVSDELVIDPAPDVPTAPSDAPVPDELVIDPVPPAATKDGTQLLGPVGEPIAQEAPAGDASGDSAPPTETGQVDQPEERATTQSPRRPLSLYPLPVWPD